jgi:hypothetical protein
VSDSYIRLIPTDQLWQPEAEAAAAAAGYVAGLFAAPAGRVDEVEVEFYDRVTLIDAGVNTSLVYCSRCGEEIGVDWFFDLLGEIGVSFDDLDVKVPCCGAIVSLDSLRYDWPVGFARFEVSVMNPTRDKYELDAAELADVAARLGHPVTQILAHY